MRLLWSHRSITVLTSPHQFAPTGSFLANRHLLSFSFWTSFHNLNFCDIISFLYNRAYSMHTSSQYSRQSIRRTMVCAAVTITSTQRHTSLLISSRRRKLEVHHFEVLILMKIFYPGILRTLLMMQTFSNHFIRVIFVIFCPHFFQIWWKIQAKIDSNALSGHF